MRCVVCGTEVHPGQAQYANDWERTRKKSPCCSVDCCSRFNPDVHWIPCPLPAPASDGEEARLLKVARSRLRDGDRPTVILREMLLAGVSPSALRKVLIDAQLVSARGERVAGELNGAGLVVGALTGWFSWFRSRDKRDPGAIEDALRDLNRWDKLAAAGAKP